MVKEYLILSGGKIYTENGVENNSAIVVKNKVIDSIIKKENIKKFPSAKVLDFPENFSILPGFIDMHIHGANGRDVMDASFDALVTISETLAKEGTTSYLATTMTAPETKIENVLCHVRDYISRQDKVIGAGVLGVHLEGPFLSPEKVGAQRGDLILDPNVELIERWQSISNNIIKLITLAPELTNSVEFVRYLKRNQIIAAIGHTNATFAETMAAISAGCDYATHLFNAMRGIHQREPGAVTAALLSDQVTAELIVDGIHLHPAIVEMIFKLKGKEKLILVTDAMRAKCLQDGVYDLGDQAVEVKNSVARLADGTLAGSTLKMSDAVKNMLQYVKCDLSDLVNMTAANPAKILGVFHRKGSIAANKDADLVILDDKMNLVMTICGGRF